MVADNRASAGAPHNEASVGEPYAFTLKIVEPGGQGYYEVRSDALGPLRPVTESVYRDLMSTMVEMDIDTAHQAEEVGVRFAGTFFVNLAAFRKAQE